MLKVPLGLKPSLGPTFGALLRRSRNQLELLHSGQQKLDGLTDEQYLSNARLVIVDDEYVVHAPIPEPTHADLVGYDRCDLPQGLGGRERAEEPGGGARDQPMDLGAALDALLTEGVAHGAKCVGAAGDGHNGHGTEAANEAGAPPIEAEASAWQRVKLLAPAEASRLRVDQALGCIENSSGMLTQVAAILESSPNVVSDIRSLERRTGLSSGPSRTFIASRQGELIVDVDGHPVPFAAPPIRAEVAGQDVVGIQVQLVPTKAENDVLRVDVLKAHGKGLPGGVTTLGSHDIRYVGLVDWQRGVLLILRGTGALLDLGVREGIGTTRLVRKPALVVDAGDWSELKRLAMEALAAATAISNKAEGGLSCAADNGAFESEQSERSARDGEEEEAA